MPNLNALSRTLGRVAERDMTDTGRITRSVDADVFDEETGTYEPGTPIVVYEGKCRIVPSRAGRVNTVEAAGQLVGVKAYDIYLPRNTEGILEEDLFEAVASSDPELVGQVSWIRDVVLETFHPTRRLLAEYHHRVEPPEVPEGS